MAALLNFSESNKIGVGFLITRGGAPQFTIAWDYSCEPELKTLDNASRSNLLVDGKPASEYSCVEVNGRFVLSHAGDQPAETVTTTEKVS